MPAPWARGAICRVVGKVHGQDCINVWTLGTNTVVLDGGPLDALLLQLATAMLQCAVDVLLPAVSSDYTLIQCDARAIYPTASDPVIATAPANSIGQLGPCSVSFAASLVNIRTGNGGRRGRGKKFLPPPGEAQTTNGSMDNPTLVLLTQYLACVAGKFVGAGKTEQWDLGVLSIADAGSPPANFDLGFRVATQLSPVALLARAGRRKIGKGS